MVDHINLLAKRRNSKNKKSYTSKLKPNIMAHERAKNASQYKMFETIES